MEAINIASDTFCWPEPITELAKIQGVGNMCYPLMGEDSKHLLWAINTGKGEKVIANFVINL